ncbi:hypothetical protein TMEN_6239 [Trichophyton mentagrophytes]|nr:hypothetical protein TMEN_6239 [Trichophyton mentagrophytes]
MAASCSVGTSDSSCCSSSSSSASDLGPVELAVGGTPAAAANSELTIGVTMNINTTNTSVTLLTRFMPSSFMSTLARLLARDQDFVSHQNHGQNQEQGGNHQLGYRSNP